MLSTLTRGREKQSNMASEETRDWLGAEGEGGRDADVEVKVQFPSGATIRTFTYQ